MQVLRLEAYRHAEIERSSRLAVAPEDALPARGGWFSDGLCAARRATTRQTQRKRSKTLSGTGEDRTVVGRARGSCRVAEVGKRRCGPVKRVQVTSLTMGGLQSWPGA